MSSSLQRLRNRITGNIFGAAKQSNPIEKPDLSRGAHSLCGMCDSHGGLGGY